MMDCKEEGPCIHGVKECCFFCPKKKRCPDATCFQDKTEICQDYKEYINPDYDPQEDPNGRTLPGGAGA